MSMINIDHFGGEIPRLGRELLPDGAAQLASNALLLSGELRGLHFPQFIQDLTSVAYAIGSFWRIPSSPADEWVTFASKDTNFVKGPLVNDAYDRYYWTTDGSVPQYNTLARIKNDDPPYILGAPQPVLVPSVTPSGGTGDPYTRGYAYTFVSEYGEESTISEITLATGAPDGTWTIANMDVSVPDASDRPAFTKRIYRTISGDLGTTLYFVAEILLTDVSYVDTATDDAISLNSQNESLNYFPPPDDLEGIIVHPNGFLVGFVGRDIYFSDPYRPHAWPTDYILSTRDNIVGLGQFGNSIVVLTDGAPAVASGNTPENITLKHSDFTEPCLSKYGIVNMPFGVYFPGPNGLMLVNSQGINNATKDLLTKDDWRLNYFPNLISAARWQDFYIAFYTDSNGFMFAPSEPQAAFTTIDGYWYQDYFATDHNTGEVLMVRENNVYEWNPPAGVPKTYVWRSKEFRLPKPVNLSAFRIYWDVNYLTEEQVAMVSEYNEQRIAAGPLNTFAMHPLNSSDIYDLSQYYPYSKMPFGGSPLIDTTVAGDSTLIFRLYANGELKHTESIANEGMYRLPSGFKDDRYYIELEGKVNIKSVRIAETGKELQRA